MNYASYDITDMLEADSTLGLTFADNLHRAKEPPNPDNVVTVYDTPSFPPEPILDRTSWYYRSSIQIRVRHNSYATGITWARDIMESLHNRAQEEWNGTLYTVIQAVGEPAPMAWDENNRPIFIINFNLQRTEV